MSLTLELTWPLRTDICLDFLPACARALNSAKIPRSPLLDKQGDQLRVRGVFNAKKRVPDTDSFRIESTNGTMSLSERRDIPLTDGTPLECTGDTSPPERPFCATLAVILESPHKDEFDKDFTPLAPAKGQTGRNLDNRLIDVIVSAPALGSEPALKTKMACHLPVRIVLCNPVQFQASLYVVHEKRLCKDCRDFLKRKVWRALWSQNEIRYDFLERLKHMNPNWILNACVKDGDFNWEVSSFLANNLSGTDLYETVHPVGWKPTWTARCKLVL